MDFSSFFGQGNSSSASTGSGTAGGAGYSNASRSAAANQLTPTIIVGGIGNSGPQSAAVTPSLSASPEGYASGLGSSGGNTFIYALLASILVAVLVRR